MNLGDIADELKGIGSGLVFLVVMYGGLWLRGVFAQKKRNDINEIDLVNKKIDFENQSKPIDQLVSDSNKSHDANAMVEKPRNDDKKK